MRWQKPVPGSYKLNIDAALFDGGIGAIAALLRNYRGEAIAGASERIDHTLNAQTQMRWLFVEVFSSCKRWAVPK